MLLHLLLTISLFGFTTIGLISGEPDQRFVDQLPSQGVRFSRVSSENVGEFGAVYTEKVSQGQQFSWTFNYAFDSTHAVEPVVHTSVDYQASAVFPVVFEVRHHQSQSWTLPVVIGDNGWVHREINKTLCTPPENGAADVEQSVEVIVSTKSNLLVPFTLSVTLKNIKIISLNQNTVASVSPTSPTYFKLGPFLQDITSPYARLDVNLIQNAGQKNAACFTVSIQSPRCPVQDSQNNVQYGSGVSHTMSTTTTLSLHRDYFRQERFLIFVMHHDYSYCNSSQSTWKDQLLEITRNANYPKSSSIQQLKFVVRESVSSSTYVYATLGVSVFFVIVCSLFVIIYLKWLRNENLVNRERGIISESSSPSQRYHPCFLLFQVKDYTSRMNVNLQDGCKKSPEQISKSTDRFLGTFWVVSLFYALPVIQFVLLYQRVLIRTGNEDLCYFNFKCLHALGDVTAFNHIFSNIGYIILGMLFLFIVHIMSQIRYRRREELADKGIFNHNGIYYAMGSALVMEGFMSSFYHVCPTHLNFQFDTCFMYITAMLCLVKIYQTRHPDSNASANMAFLGMALVVFLSVITTIYQVWWLWMIITILHVFASLLFSVHLYSWGDWRFWKWDDDLDKVDSPWQTAVYEKCKQILKSFLFPFRRPVEPIAGFLVALNILNWAFAVVGHVMLYDSQDIGSYLLMLFLLNMAVYSAIYVILKVGVAKERILWPSWIYLGLSVPFWVAGMTMFFRLTATWDQSQAESRELNSECTFLSFYDYHDVWHFLSACGMFFLFMFFFSLDDGLLETERNRIKVF